MRLAEIAGLSVRLVPPSRQRWLAAGVSVTILGLIFWRIRPERILSALAEVRPIPALASVMCVVGAGLLLAIRWRWMLRLQGVNDGFFAVWRGVLVGNALNAAMLGAVLSDVAKSAWYARRHGHSFPGILLACGLDRACGGIGVFLYGIATIVVAVWTKPKFWGQLEFNPSGTSILVVAGLGIVVAFLVLRLRRHARSGPTLAEFRRRILTAWRTLHTRPLILTSAIAVSVAANLLVGATLACGLAAIYPNPIPWASLIWTLPVIGLAASMPFSLAGAGAREGAAIALWIPYGVSGPQAVAACLLTLTATLIVALPGALLFLYRGATESSPTST